jgi:hypothetical protein
MTGMGNIGASYKYCRKSPYEAKAYYFGLPSSIFLVFRSSSETLPIFQKKLLLSILFCSQSPSPFIDISECFFKTNVVCQCFAGKIFNGAVAKHALWNLRTNYFACWCLFLKAWLMLLYTMSTFCDFVCSFLINLRL